MLRRALALVFIAVLAPLVALADHNTAPRGKIWVQAVLVDSFDDALARARGFAEDFEFTRVFLTDEGAFAVALGVTDTGGADRTIRDLVRKRQAPRGTVAANGEEYLTELWYAKKEARDGDGFLPGLKEAVDFEGRMKESDRSGLQVALAWAGDFTGTVDGAFGPVTRQAIRAFQAREKFAVTGFLTRPEREQLAVLRAEREAATGWRLVEDGPLGIRVGLPLALFAGVEKTEIGKRLSGRGEASGALLSLIALDGGRKALDDLFRAAQGELAGDRDRLESRDASSFLITGRSGDRVLYSYAVRSGEVVRGFILAYDSARSGLIGPLAEMMRASFAARAVAAAPLLETEIGKAPAPRSPPRPETPPPVRRDPQTAENTGSGIAGTRPQRPPRPNNRGELDETPEDEAPRVTPPPRRPPPGDDEPRRDDRRDVDSTGSGFYVSLDGKILTNNHVVDGCKRMIVDGTDEARVVAVDKTHDLAILDHRKVRTEADVAKFSPAAPRLASDITVVGYPLYGLLGGLNVTRGIVSSLKGLRGDETFIQISAEVQPGNSGGPAVDDRGYVVGIVQSKLDALRLSRISGDIPQNINFAVRAELAREFLTAQGVAFLTGAERPSLPPADLADEAKRFTVLLECIK